MVNSAGMMGIGIGMSGVEYIYLGCAIGIVVVVGFGWVTKFGPHAWITKGLKRGDLHSLTDVATGLRPDGLTQSQFYRLQARGLARDIGGGQYRATFKGKLALLIRRIARASG